MIKKIRWYVFSKALHFFSNRYRENSFSNFPIPFSICRWLVTLIPYNNRIISGYRSNLIGFRQRSLVVMQVFFTELFPFQLNWKREQNNVYSPNTINFLLKGCFENYKIFFGITLAIKKSTNWIVKAFSYWKVIIYITCQKGGKEIGFVKIGLVDLFLN